MRCNIYLFTSHPPKVPFSLVPYTFSCIQLLLAAQLSPSQTTKAEGKPVPQAFNPSGQPQKGASPKTAVSQWSQKALLIAGLQATKVPKCGSKRLLARIWPKKVVSQWSQTALSIAGWQATKVPKSGSKRPLARMWPNTAVSQWSQKALSIAGVQATKVPQSGFWPSTLGKCRFWTLKPSQRMDFKPLKNAGFGP